MDEFQKYMDILCSEFESNFKEVYAAVKAPNKNKILDYVPEIFNKWCASAMFEDTVLTPYALIEDLNDKAKFTDAIYFPVAHTKSKKRYYGIEFSYIPYSLEDHPIVRDIYKVIEVFSPTVELNEYGYIQKQYCEAAFSKISIESYQYLEYLFYLCLNMGIIESMPSLYTDMYIVNEEKAGEFMNRGKQEALGMVIDTAADLLVDGINEFMPDDEAYIDREYVYNYMKYANSADEMVIDIYDLLDININEVFAKDPSAIDEYDSMILSTVYALGTILDKSFFTPFAAYFHFIQPLFVMPLDTMREFDIILASNIDYEASDMLLMPAHRYSMTRLSADYFGIKHVTEYKKLFSKMNASYVLDNLTSGLKSLNRMKSLAKPKIYSFKVSSETREMAFLIELEENSVLADLHRVICQAYSLSLFSEYSFYMASEPSPFFEYTPLSYKKRKYNKTDITAINSDDIADVKKFIYTNYPSGRGKKGENTEIFSVLRIDIHPNDSAFVYPRTLRYYE